MFEHHHSSSLHSMKAWWVSQIPPKESTDFAVSPCWFVHRTVTTTNPVNLVDFNFMALRGFIFFRPCPTSQKTAGLPSFLAPFQGWCLGWCWTPNPLAKPGHEPVTNSCSICGFRSFEIGSVTSFIPVISLANRELCFPISLQWRHLLTEGSWCLSLWLILVTIFFTEKRQKLKTCKWIANDISVMNVEVFILQECTHTFLLKFWGVRIFRPVYQPLFQAKHTQALFLFMLLWVK